MSELLSGISAYFANLTTAEGIWLGIGFFGQALFFPVGWSNGSRRNAKRKVKFRWRFGT